MGHVKDVDERWALMMLEQILLRVSTDRDCLPGAFVKKIKEVRALLRKRRAGRCLDLVRGKEGST